MNSSDWQHLCEECHLGRVIQATAVRGSASDRSWHLETTSGSFFVKTSLSRFLPLLESEAAALEAIRQTHTLRCPRVMNIYRGTKWAGMILEWLTLAHDETPQDKHYDALAEALADLHGHHAKSFGWTQHNFLELSAQPNTRLTEWNSFWRGQRLLPQLKMARDRGLSRNTLADVEAVMQEMDVVFAAYSPIPAFVHGNFWSDNIAFLPHRVPVVFKPACYYGDPLIDLARAKLAGDLPEAFYHAYWRYAKHHEQEQIRLELYQLYYLLHQFNHLGGAYTQPINQLTKQLLKEIAGLAAE
jgi:fructosamine-3-kinase